MALKSKWKRYALVCALLAGMVVTAIKPTPEAVLAMLGIIIMLLAM